MRSPYAGSLILCNAFIRGVTTSNRRQIRSSFVSPTISPKAWGSSTAKKTMSTSRPYPIDTQIRTKHASLCAPKIKMRGGSPFSSQAQRMATMDSVGKHATNTTDNNNNREAMAVVAVLTATATAATTFCEKKPKHVPIPFPDQSLTYDTYRGVTVDVETLPEELKSNPEAFGVALDNAIDVWKNEGKRGVWMKVSTRLSSLIKPIVDQGFDFQLAEPGRVILTRWLPDDCESKLPNPPSHQVGIGALILHPTALDKMLCVQEKSGPAAKAKLWKMPTGLSDRGEDIHEAAIREVKEETGLVVNFDRIVCMRQAHNIGAYGVSDLFVVCLLRLDEEYYNRSFGGLDNIELRPQESEIAQVEWMDVKDFCEQDLWVKSPLYHEMNKAMLTVIDEEKERKKKNNADDNDGDESKKKIDSGLVAKTLPLGYRPASNTIYTNSRL